MTTKNKISTGIPHFPVLTFFFFLFLISIPISLALDDYYAIPQDELSRAGLFSQTFTNIDNTTTIISTQITDGSNFQPLILDIDNDGQNEIIGTDASQFKIWRESSNTISLVDEKTLLGTQTTQIQALVDDDGNDIYDSDSFVEIFVTVDSNKTYVLEYNGTSINIEQQDNISIASFQTSPVCGNFSGSQTCYLGGTGGNLIEYNFTTGSTQLHDLSASLGVFIPASIKISPPAEDIDRDGVFEIGFICDHDADGVESVCVIDHNTKSLDSYFSTDGIYETPYAPTGAGEDTEIQGIIFHNLDSAGDVEVVFSYHVESGCVAQTCEDSYLVAMTASGSAFWTQIKTYDESKTTVVTETSNPITSGEIYSGSGNAICVLIDYIDSAPNEDRTIAKCYRGLNSSQSYSQTFGSGASDIQYYDVYDNILFIPSAGNTGYYNIMSSYGIIDIQDATSSIWIPTSERLSNLAVGDVDDDGFVDACVMDTNIIECNLLVIDNTEPTFSVFPSTGINGDIPLCANETYTVSTLANNVYFDADGDVVRMAVDCNNNGTIEDYSVYGVSGLNNLDGECTFTDTGTYTIAIYLQDNFLASAGQLSTAVSTITGVVVSADTSICGSPGTGVSTDSTASSVLGGTGTTPESQFANFITDTGLNSNWILIIWVAIMLMMTIGAWQIGIQSGMGIITVNAFMLILGVLFGAVPGWIVLMLSIVGVGGLVLVFFMGRGGV